MSVEERLDRLEQRLQVLETLMRDVVRARGTPPLDATARGITAPQPDAVLAPKTSPAAASQAEPVGSTPPLSPRAPDRAAALKSNARGKANFLRSEEWIGQRGLLAIGVLALILAAGYLLKLSFDRGWISPFVRCVGGAIAGGVVGALGWRMLARYRTYGASLIGCGAAIMYLAVWAAAKLYGLLPPATGIGALALVSLGLAAVAFAINVEVLGTSAALGAFIAPVLLGKRGNPDAGVPRRLSWR
jgi:uncharacterized membrane protein